MTRNQLLSGVVAVFLLTTTAVVQADEASDQQITQQVKEKITTNQPQLARRIEVTTHDGVVSLRGTTMTPTAMLGVLHDAGAVQGVTKIENHLAVQ